MIKKGLHIKVVILLAFFLSAIICFSDIKDDINRDAAKIAGEVFIGNRVYHTLQVLSDEYGPRLTGSEEGHKGEEFCLNLFKEYGLENAHLEYFNAVGWLRGETAAEMLEPLKRSLTVDSMGQSINTPAEGLIAEVIDLGAGTEEEFKEKGDAIKGKLAMAGGKQPPEGEGRVSWLDIIDRSAEYGASACFYVSPLKGRQTQTGTSGFGEYSPLPAAGITYEDGTWIRRLLESGKGVKVKLIIQNKIVDKLQAADVVAEIKGIEKPQEIVILGGHLDSWDLGSGAADNGLGSAITLETARVLSTLGIKSKRTIRFILFSGEEQGLMGSFAYTNKHETELDKVAMMMNVDMAGLSYPGGFNTGGRTECKDKLSGLVELLEGFGVERLTSRLGMGSDDFPFSCKGVPTVSLSGRDRGDWNYYHSCGDTFDKIDIDKLNMATAAIAITVYYVANLEEPLARRLSQEEVIKLFKEKKLDVQLKKRNLWKKIGFPEDKEQEKK
jgi:carboxypeptidase Q